MSSGLPGIQVVRGSSHYELQRFYKELGAPELGFLLLCGVDFPMIEGFGPDVELTRTQTTMQGASHYERTAASP